MKRNIISIIIGCVLGTILGCVAIHQQPIQRQKEIEAYKKYSVTVIRETEDEDSIEVEEYWEFAKRQEEMEIERILRMREADRELTELGIEIPPQVREYCEDAGKIYGISPEFLEAVCWTESNCQANAVNGSCKGIMQISERWHNDRMERLGVTSIFDEQGNIMVGADYLAELFEDYEDAAYVLAIYNGDSHADEYVANYTMSDYANKVLTIANLLEKANGK